MAAPSDSNRPWHQPGKWLVNSAYWDEEAQAARPQARRSVRFIDCTVSEGDDCVRHQLNWTEAHARISVPSTLKCSEESNFACSACCITRPNNVGMASCSISRSRFWL